MLPHAGADLGRGRTRGRVRIRRVHLDSEVEAVEERRREPPEVPGPLDLRTAAIVVGAAAGAGVAAGDQEEVRRELDRAGCAADAHDAFFEGMEVSRNLAMRSSRNPASSRCPAIARQTPQEVT